jgi:hypothetical protein
MIITFGALAVFFLAIVFILTVSWIRDRTFYDYAVRAPVRSAPVRFVSRRSAFRRSASRNISFASDNPRMFASCSRVPVKLNRSSPVVGAPPRSLSCQSVKLAFVRSAPPRSQPCHRMP